MIGILGDIHGFYDLVVDYSKSAKDAGAMALIQAGDWGMSSIDISAAKAKSRYPYLPTYVVPGNHEYFNQWDGFEGVKEVMNNVFFVQKGVILKIDGLNILFFGGASSIDKKWQGESWDWREDIQPADVARFEKNYDLFTFGSREDIDLMISHVPPKRVIDKNFDPTQKLAFGQPITWEDQSAPIIEKIWDQIGNPPLFCGHMHRRVKDNGCQILNINEMVMFPQYDVATVLSQKTIDEKDSRKAELDALRSSRVEDIKYEGSKYILKPPLDKEVVWH